MANTYSQLYYHFVWAVRNRQSIITPQIKDDLLKYITGIVTKQGQKMMIINSHLDHIHMFVSCKTNVRPDELMKEVKEHSTKYINNNRMVPGKFYWQGGYGAFSVSEWNREIIINYIKNQEEHHRKKTFRKEYIDLLKQNGIEYDDRYVFHNPTEFDE